MTSHACSFCAKTQEQVKTLIGGPDGGVFICNDCVSLCVHVLEEGGIALSPVVETDHQEMGHGRIISQAAVIPSEPPGDPA